MKEKGAIPQQKNKTKTGGNIPGWRKGQGLPATSIQQSPEQNLSGSEGKVQRYREEPGPGRGLLVPSATLTQLKQATPSTTSSMKKSAAARPSGSGNLDCVATETTTSRESPGLARRGTGTEPRGFLQAEAWWPGNRRSPRTLPRSQVGGKGPRGTGREGDRERKRRV